MISRQSAKMFALIISIVAIAVSIFGCGKEGPQPVSTGGAGKSGILLNGAGATFPYPVYAKWADKYNQLTGVMVNYQSIGSGGGVQQIKAGTVDFGASDAPLTLKELDESGLIQFPMVMGGVVPIVNLKDIKPGQIKLTPQLLSNIYLGTIKKWNDPSIVKENAGIKLPNKNITVVHRADGSGTTWIFTNYLDKVSPAWHKKSGFGKSVNWPVGVGGKGNEGVSAYVQRIEGSIGYVEYAYAMQNKMGYVQLKNKSGNYVKPSTETFQSAAANADWKNAPGYYVVLNDQPGKNSWPITGASYIIIHKKQSDANKTEAMLKFFDWSYSHGAAMAEELDYVPMPDSVIELVRNEWKQSITVNNKAVWK